MIKSLLNIRLRYSPTIVLKRFQQGKISHLLSGLRSGSSMRRNCPFVTGFTSSTGTGGLDFSAENRMKDKSNNI